MRTFEMECVFEACPVPFILASGKTSFLATERDRRFLCCGSGTSAIGMSVKEWEGSSCSRSHAIHAINDACKRVTLISHYQDHPLWASPFIPLFNMWAVLSILFITVLFLLYSGMHPGPPKGELSNTSVKSSNSFLIIGYRYPPGPRGKPLIGQLGEEIYSLEVLKKWRQKYGERREIFRSWKSAL